MHPAGLCAASLGSLGLLRLLGAPWPWSLAATFGVYLGGGGWRLLRLIVKTAPRDLFWKQPKSPGPESPGKRNVLVQPQAPTAIPEGCQHHHNELH